MNVEVRVGTKVVIVIFLREVNASLLFENIVVKPLLRGTDEASFCRGFRLVGLGLALVNQVRVATVVVSLTLVLCCLGPLTLVGLVCF